MDNIDIGKKYFELFENNIKFQKEYLSPKRIKLYQKIVSILKGLSIDSVLDVGCAYGLLVEHANSEGIEAWGLDLPIENLKNFHSGLQLSKGKFIYESIEDKKVIEHIKKYKIQAYLLLDSLRHLGEKMFDAFSLLGAEYIIIKEISNNIYIRQFRKYKNQFDYKLYSPNDYHEIFPQYYIYRIYSSKFLFHINKPNSLCLNVMGLLPTYTLVLKKRS